MSEIFRKLSSFSIKEGDVYYSWISSLHIHNELYHLLSPDEVRKIEKLRFEEDRKSSIISRAGLRMILSKYLNVPPKKIEFQYGKLGKPFLSTKTQKEVGNIFFNLSHSKDLILYAFSWQNSLGVDIEFINREIDVLGLAYHFFTEEEFKFVKTSRTPYETFYQIWVLKEAYLKELGYGLTTNLNSFSIPLSRTLKIKEKKVNDSILYLLKIHPSYSSGLAINNLKNEHNLCDDLEITGS